MVIISQPKVLTVGMNDKAMVLRKLPIRVVVRQNGREAVRSLKTENFDSVICRWDLADMKDGRFLKSLRLAKPYIPTIVIIQANNFGQEIAARSLGVSAVITEDSNDEYFLDTVRRFPRLRINPELRC